jgi:heat shock protein HslJ
MSSARGTRISPGLAAVLALALALAGCAEGSGSPGSDPEPDDFQGRWHLVSGRDADGAFPALPGRRVTLVWDAEGVGGTSACNLYGATVEVDGNTVRFTNPSGTEMACEPEVMEVERRYLAALTASERVGRAGDTLTLSGPDVALEFRLHPQVRDADLVGTPWLLESLVDGDSVSSALPGGELRFRDDGVLLGNSGCRRLRGRFEVEDDTVVVTGLDDDLPVGACPRAEESQHSQVVDVLVGGFTTEIDGDRLTLTSTRSASGLQFRAG